MSSHTEDNKKKQSSGQGSGLESILVGYDKMISSYDLVIQDLSGEIYDPVLRAKREPVLAFLKNMRNQWATCRADAQRQVETMNGKETR